MLARKPRTRSDLSRSGRSAFSAAGAESRSASVARTFPHAIDERLVAAILARRKRHPTWGPKNLLVLLAGESPSFVAIAAILKRHGDRISPERNRISQAERQPI